MRVTADLQPEHYRRLAREAREQYRRLPEQAAYVIAKALSNGEIHENTAVAAAVFSGGENDAPAKAHVSH